MHTAIQRVILSMAAMGAIGCASDPLAKDTELVVSAETLTFCCDAEQPFPQQAGSIRFENQSLTHPAIVHFVAAAGVISTLGTDEGAEVSPGTEFSDTLAVSSCGDASASYEVSAEPRFTHTVSLQDRCPVSVSNESDPELDPSLDMSLCDAARSESGQAWAACTVEGDWPPAETLFSWFIRCSLQDAQGVVTNECVFQRHNGVALSYCNVGTVNDFDLRQLETGFACVFAGASSETGTGFAVETGVQATEADVFVVDRLVGNFEEDLVPAPSEDI